MKRNKPDQARFAGSDLRRSDPADVAACEQLAWRTRLGQLAIACAGAFIEDENDRIREARALLALAPHPALVSGIDVPDENQLERLIAAGANADAALALITTDVGYLLSRSGGGQYLASVMLPGATADCSACGDTLALALIGALARALSELPAVSARLN